MASKQEVIEHLKKNKIHIDNLPAGHKILGWTVKLGALENYLESDEYVGLVESSIYDSDLSSRSNSN